MVEINSYLDLLTAVENRERPVVVRLVERSAKWQRWHACTACYLDALERQPRDTPWETYVITLESGEVRPVSAPPTQPSCYMCFKWIVF